MKMLDREQLKKNIETRIQADMADGKISEASMLVRQRGEIVYQGFFGDKTREDSLFRLASMTKPITTVAVLLLVERGLVHLEDPVSKFLPAYGIRDIAVADEEGNVEITGRATQEVKVIHLLTHSSGMGCRYLGAWHGIRRPEESLLDLEHATDYYAALPLAFEPGTAPDYSPIFGFDVLARIVEVASGESFDKFLEREIFRPLGMNDTTFAPSEEQWQRMIPMHDRVDGKSCLGQVTENCVFEWFPSTYFCGGAGLASTLADYDKFAQMLLHDGAGVLKPETAKDMRTPHYDIWGLGVRTVRDETVFPPLPVGCFGWSGAYGTHFWVDPANEITAVFMRNSRYDGGSEAVISANFEKDVYNAMD